MGNTATTPKADAKPTDDLNFGSDPVGLAELEKAQIIASPVKAAALAITTEAIERVMRVAKALRSATIKDDTGTRPLSLVIGRELRSITGLLKSLRKRNDHGRDLIHYWRLCFHREHRKQVASKETNR